MNKALIIVDMSNDFVHEDGGLTAGKPAQELVPYIIDLADSFLANDDVVAVAMDAHQENDDHFKLWPVHNVIGTWGQQLYGGLKEWYVANEHKDNVLYIPKINYNAFFKTDLAEELMARGIQEVHVVGVVTEICDFATIAGADAHGFRTVLHKRGVATFTHNVPALAGMLKDGYVPADLLIELMRMSFHTAVIE
ncbi:isochorismatase family cysteine hydrolase [Paenibacillus abyssi]|uniref:Isochorismatase n=1 Tax=Paenibacillus abyssi TaxID=1340531 RepID=A0A917LD88_9BACL|nr:isochorismatase family cysteine hydrolase [Paenibacillus abyssi]GGG14601.1 isochorismatase [Paenibacillus abyssi]